MNFLKALGLTALGLFVGFLVAYPMYRDNNGPFYFACMKKGEKEFVVKTEKKPSVHEGIVTFEDDTVWFPPADTYCRTVKVSDVEDSAQSAP